MTTQIIYKWAPEPPSISQENNPPGWYDTPNGMLKMTGDDLWMSYCTKNESQQRISLWSPPSRVNLKEGQAYTTLFDKPEFDKPIDMTEEDWREYLRKEMRTLTLKHNKIFDIGGGGINEPLETHKHVFLDELDAAKIL